MTCETGKLKSSDLLSTAGFESSMVTCSGLRLYCKVFCIWKLNCLNYAAQQAIKNMLLKYTKGFCTTVENFMTALINTLRN